MKVLAVLNLEATSLATGLAERVRRGFEETGVEAEVVTALPREIEPLFREGLRAGRDALVAGGGDGTIGAAARVLAGTGTPLGVIPLGRLNHFAQDAGIPSDLDAAVRAIGTAEARPVDVGEVNGRVFINNSSIGIYPLFVRERSARERRGMPRRVAAAFSALRFLVRYPLFRVRFGTGGEGGGTEAPLVFVGNNRYELRLTGFGRRARLDEGTLFLFAVCCRTRTCFVRQVFRAMTGRRGDASLRLAVPEARIEARRRLISVATDGEVSRLAPPLLYRVRPRDLLVLRPAPEPPPPQEGP